MHARQIQFALEGLLAKCAIEVFEIGEALLVAGFDAFDFFDDGCKFIRMRPAIPSGI